MGKVIQTRFDKNQHHPFESCDLYHRMFELYDQYSATSIIRTSFIRHLDYPDSLQPSNVLVRMRRGCDCSYLVGVAIV